MDMYHICFGTRQALSWRQQDSRISCRYTGFDIPRTVYQHSLSIHLYTSILRQLGQGCGVFPQFGDGESLVDQQRQCERPEFGWHDTTACGCQIGRLTMAFWNLQFLVEEVVDIVSLDFKDDSKNSD